MTDSFASIFSSGVSFIIRSALTFVRLLVFLGWK